MEAEAADAPPGGVESALSCFSFNQDCTSLAIGTKAGYKLFSLSSVEQLDQVHGSNEIPDVYIVERLFSSSLVVVVSHTKPRQMNVYHFKKGTEICNYSYSSNILSIRLNRQRLLVCLEESIYIHNIKDMKLLKTLLDIPANPTGLCALSINHSNSYLAYPGSLTSGEIVLYDGNSLKTVCTIAAHEGTLAAITFNASGSKLASASEKGTVIRVFSVPDGQKLYEFRRGMKRYVTISSLVFSMDSQFLCASSNTETVHIFKLEQVTNRQSTRRAFDLEWLHGKDVHGCYQLPPHPGVRHDASGQGFCHRTLELLRTEEHLYPLNDPEVATAASCVIQWTPLYVQFGSSGWRRVCLNQNPQLAWLRNNRRE
ncbi:WIPI1 isoform 4 [Pan troglodytes]|uniref:WIPI1 isoform 4 n=1 Tax=Pan troglodytes TaxID=9598 RepID=A0A2J8KKL4_PANTR|nr:WIPI1 isoform 4 [Pan troglodytes]